jgi:anti-sigma regulatory factor (Ser/Thr protein kinase)
VGKDSLVKALDSLSSFDAQLPAVPASVVAARRLVESAAAAWALPAGVGDDATLAVSELVTNAVLHAGTMVHVTVSRLGGGLRLEVQDGSTRLPVVGAERPEDLLATRSMTGRGLALLAGTADRWGADPIATGKVMWAEVGTGQRHVEAVQVAPARAVAAEPVGSAMAPVAGLTSVTALAAQGRQVRLIGVPVRLLVESARQFADLQREMQVMALDHNGASELVALAETSQEVSARIGRLRQAGSDVAEAALARGDAVIDFEVVVAEDAIDAFDRLGSRIWGSGDDAARQELLTTPPTDEVAAYRQWYVDEIAAQLTGQAPRRCPLAPVS